MANMVYMSKTGLIGGEATKLDSIDGAGLVDNDAAFVNVANVQYIYRLDADSGAAESSPAIIAPDTNPGDKRWILQNLYPVTSWVDYSSISTVSGWAAGYNATIKYAVVGKVVCVYYNITGTSNNSVATFTLPIMSIGASYYGCGLTVDVGAATSSGGLITMIDYEVALSKDMAGAEFTTSGTKQVGGSFFYPIA